MNQELKNLCKKSLEEKDKSTPLRQICKFIESNPSQATYLWSFNGIPILLLQEIIQAYYLINTENFTTEESSKICVVLNIIQVLVESKEVRAQFINIQLPFYIYPFLNTSEISQQYESLRIASLGVIGSLMKDEDEKIIGYLKNTEIVPLALKIMDIGSEVSKIIATYVFLKIINNKEGLEYACQTFERFVAITVILNSVVYQCIHLPSPKLLKCVLECYIRLASKDNVLQSFCSKKPEALMNAEIQKQISDSNECKDLFEKFINLVSSVETQNKIV